MNHTVLEKRLCRLEKRITESLKRDAVDEIRNELSHWLNTYGVRPLKSLRAELVDYRKGKHFNDFLDAIENNESDAFQYYCDVCEYSNLYECDELDDDIIDVIDELLDM